MVYNINLAKKVDQLYRTYGPPKQMGGSVGVLTRPHFFLHRNFLGEQDLAILFNTKRCQYQCKFCALPHKSSRDWIDTDSILAQFEYVITEMKHSLGILDRFTIANEGSVFDERTFPTEALFEIIGAATRLPRLAKFVFESRLEFVDTNRLQRIRATSGRRVDILTGFETLDEYIREDILGKREPLEVFQSGLDRLADCGCELTTYVLFKPSPYMTDTEAIAEAERSIDYVASSCDRRGIPFIIRLNPMYVAESTPWARLAKSLENYQPPKLTDVIALADKKKSEGMKVYLGLTSEGLSSSENTYRGREDFSSKLLKQAIIANTP